MLKRNRNKTIGEIEHKAMYLKEHLMRKEIIENFGEREQHILDKYIGDVYDYPYYKRQKIHDITGNFFNWCASYDGN